MAAAPEADTRADEPAAAALAPEAAPGRDAPVRRSPFDWVRKLAAVVLVLGGVTVGIVGLMFVTTGTWWGFFLILATPLCIWLATRVTPEGGTTGYFDKNI